MERELAACIGPNADAYRKIFERFTREGPPRFAFSWNGPAFFGGVCWT